MTRAPLAALLALSALVSGTLVGALPGLPAHAAAASPARAAAARTQPAPSQVTVTIATVRPAAPQAGQHVVLTGTVHNAGETTFTSTQVLLRLSRDRLEDRAEVQRVVENPDYRRGVRYEIAAELPTTKLLSGATLPFRLDISLDELGLTDPGVYVVGVEVRAVGSDGTRAILAADRTFVPWLVNGQRRVRVALLWPLVARPEVLPGGTLLDDALERQLLPGGRLRGLLTVGSAQRGPLTWVVDPGLLAALTRMAGGYDIRRSGVAPARVAGRAAGSAPDTVAGTAADAARDMLSLLRRAGRGGGERVVLPFADPDVTGLSRQGAAGTAVLRASVTRARQVAGAASTVLGWPYGGALDERTLSLLRVTAGPALVRASSASGGTASGGTASAAATPAGPAVRDGGTVVVRTDGALAAAYAGAGGSRASAAGATQVRQRLLAVTALAAQADPGATGPTGASEPPPMVLAPPRSWRPTLRMARSVLAAWAGSPWVRPVPLSQLLPAARAGAPPLSEDAPAALSARQQRAARAVGRGVDVFADLTDEDPPQLAPAADAAMSSWSTQWRGSAAAAAAFARASRSVVAGWTRQVSLITAERITLSGESARLPLTVANGLSVPVTVQVRARSTNADRLRITDVPQVTVAAGHKATVLVPARATTNGTVPVLVRLRTADGQVFGPERAFDVQSTDLGRVGWVVIAVAGTVLVATALLRTVRRVRGGAVGQR